MIRQAGLTLCLFFSDPYRYGLLVYNYCTCRHPITTWIIATSTPTYQAQLASVI